MLLQKLERCNLVLKEGTDGVPRDGYFYLFHKNKLVDKFKELADAQLAFEKIEKQYPPPKIDKSPATFKDVLINQLRTVSNNSLLRGARSPYQNPKKYAGK